MGHKHMYEYRQQNHHGSDLSHIFLNYLIRNLNNNKKLLVLFIIAIVFIIVICVFLLISFFPVIYKIIGYINTNGIKGVIDLISQFLEKLWLGK
jgi:hypothetical protein